MKFWARLRIAYKLGAFSLTDGSMIDKFMAPIGGKPTKGRRGSVMPMAEVPGGRRMSMTRMPMNTLSLAPV